MSGNGKDRANRPVLNWSDKVAVHKWIVDLREDVQDALAVADDQTRAPGDRGLGRRAAREMYREAEHSIEQLFDAALRGLLS